MLYGIATVVRMRREELKLPLWYVAKRSGIPVSALEKIEGGRIDPDILVFAQLARTLKSSCDDILDTATMLQHMSSMSEQRLRSRLRMRVQMERMKQQNERLIKQLNSLHRQNPVGHTIQHDEFRERLECHAKRIEVVKAQQDQRELFLLRSLRNVAALRNIKP
ncbi:MAG TPA: helix-turn-helix transcriptional regulator [Drouetiella sp.]